MSNIPVVNSTHITMISRRRDEVVRNPPPAHGKLAAAAVKVSVLFLSFLSLHEAVYFSIESITTTATMTRPR